MSPRRASKPRRRGTADSSDDGSPPRTRASGSKGKPGKTAGKSAAKGGKNSKGKGNGKNVGTRAASTAATATTTGNGGDGAAAERAAKADPTSDGVLMSRLQDGDAAAYEVLFQRYKGPLLTFLTRYTRDRQRAEDLFQQVFLKIYSARDSFRGQSSFRTWLYSIAVNAARDLYRQEKLRRVVSLDAIGPGSDEAQAGEAVRSLEPAANDPRPLDQIEDSELKDTLAEAITRLEEDYRAPFVLARFGGLSYQEISEALEITVPTVRMRVFRAHRKLAVLLAPYVKAGEPR